MPYQPGYVEGRDAGSITLSAPQIDLHGNLIAHTVVGPYQRYPAVAGGTAVDAALYRQMPLGGSLSVSQPNLLFDDDDELAPAGTLVLSPRALLAGGFSRITAQSFGGITLPADQRLDLPVGGSLALTANAVDIAGEISVAAGSVTIEAVPQQAAFGNVAVGFDLHAGAHISTRGLWVNDVMQLATDTPSSPIFIGRRRFWCLRPIRQNNQITKDQIAAITSSRRRRLNGAAASYCTQWPTPGKTSKLAPG